MKLSVIIPTLNRDEYLKNTLLDLAQQSLSRSDWECIVVTQSELNPDVYLWCSDKVNLRVFFSTIPSANHARNIGLLNSKAPLVLFFDDDILVKDNFFLEKCIDTIKGFPAASGLVGQILSPPLQVPFEKLPQLAIDTRKGWLHFKYQYTQKMWVRVGASGNLMVYRDKAVYVGGFDSQFDKGAIKEEAEFGLRYTQHWGNLLYAPECSITHIGAPVGGARSFSSWLRFHHLVGQMYFLILSLHKKHIYINEIGAYLLDTLRNLFPSKVRRHPSRFLLTSLILPVAFVFSCLKFFQGQKLISSLDPSQITLVFEAEVAVK
jgi:glycosyltransferase involved in cell wall biosynthesis